MAERRPPGFNVDLGFYDSDEVLSIPRKIRAAAIGVWTLCGSFSANKLTDGYVSAEALKDRGCTPAIRAALMSTTEADGAPSPLWVDAGGGAIQFTNWPKWQRTAAEIKAFRAADASRKKAEREAKKTGRRGRAAATSAPREPYVDATYAPGEAHVPEDIDATSTPHITSRNAETSDNAKASGRTSVGQVPDVPRESGTPKTETETDSNYESDNATEPNGLSSRAATPGAELVREIIPNDHPATTRTALRLQASELLRRGTDPDVVRAALHLWLEKPNLGVGRTIVSSLCSEVIKTRTASSAARYATAGSGQLTAGEAKVAGWAALGQPAPPTRQEAIES